LLERAKKAGPQGKLFPEVNKYTEVNNYVHSLDGGKFSAKDFRTRYGTRRALQIISGMPKPKTQAEFRKAQKAVATAVSEELVNTPSMSLKSYIRPDVWQEWQQSAGIQ
jgi:DNA topoisomerase I